jgi:glycerol transport system ATP-binding protein
MARVPGSKLKFPHTSERPRGWAGIRPHRVRLAEEPGDLRCPGSVELAELSGSETYVHISAGERSLIMQLHGTHAFKLGDPIEFYIHPGDLYFYDESGDLVSAPEVMAR